MYHRTCRQRRHRTKSITNKLIIGAVSLIIALQCKTIAFLAQLTTPIYLPAKSLCLIRRNDDVSTHATSLKTPLSMVAKSGGRLIVSTEQFEQEVLSSGIFESSYDNDPGDNKELTLPVLVLFSAPWCGPCRLTSPVVKEVMKQYQSKIEVVEISTDDLPEVASKAGVLSIPTILIYHRGEVMDTIVGCVAKNVLARAVAKVLEDLGMLGEGEAEC
mmetsp:Transcript_31658/g.57294  ORF Transcript_31658/g.57294 Transcript_31658/m.57294 type:complete len:216 (-) Transcript_31658:137-784(-)